MSGEEDSVPTSKMIPGLPTQKLIPVIGEIAATDAKNVSQKFVFDVYDKIAPHFSHTSSLPKGSFLIDAGCGNGKNLMSASHLIRFGSDRSHPFCEMARTNGKCDTVQADIARDIGKGFREGMFDAAIAIAVIHHIPDLSGRVASLKEIHRLLRHEGRALIYVWALEQKKGTIGAREFESQDIYVPWNLQSKYLKPEDGVPEGQIVPLQRYYHVFREDEFRDLLNLVPEFEVKNIYYDNNNWAAELVAIKI